MRYHLLLFFNITCINKNGDLKYKNFRSPLLFFRQVSQTENYMIGFIALICERSSSPTASMAV